MTTTYDPKHPDYLDEADVRGELTRAFGHCHSCRRCIELCTVFPTLFDLIDRFDDRDPGRLTPAEQDGVVDACFQCKRCYLDCPYVPGRHEWNLDIPRLMLRADAMRWDNDITTSRSKTTTRVLARTDLVGAVGTAAAPFANWSISRPRSVIRKLLARTTGVSAVRLLPPYARQRFSSWFKQRQRVTAGEHQGAVTVYPTCLVEYRAPGIGKDLVKVYERNGIDCEISEAGCCGAPWLHGGHVQAFAKIAERNVAVLADEVRRGTDVVVPQATCGYVLTRDYLDHVGGEDAELVARHTFDAAEYLLNLHLGDATSLDTEFHGDTVAQVTYHVACHLRARDTGLAGRDLMKLTGAKVKMVAQCSGIDGRWGLRAENEDISVPIAEQLGEQIERAGGDVVAGDCHLANTAIAEQTGRTPRHPLQVVARAYGIPAEE